MKLLGKTFPLVLGLILGLGAAVFGQTPREEYGICSYYGDEFQGRKTASGERYNKSDLTCAHRTHPFGTLLRVTRFDNKKSVVVRVTDRGPFIKGYVVDVSKRAAIELDMVREGIVKVKIEVVGGSGQRPVENSTTTPPAGKPSPGTSTVPPAQRPAPDPNAGRMPVPPANRPVNGGNFNEHDLYSLELKRPPRNGFGVQVATLTNLENVFPEIARLQGTWPEQVMVSIVPTRSGAAGNAYKLILGPFVDRQTAAKQQRLAAKKGYKRCFVVDLMTI